MAYLSNEAVERIVHAAQPKRGTYPREPQVLLLRRELERAVVGAIAFSRRRPTSTQVNEELTDIRRAVRTFRLKARPAAHERASSADRALSVAWNLMGGVLADETATASGERHDRLVVARASTLYTRQLQRQLLATLDQIDRVAGVAMERLPEYAAVEALRHPQKPASKDWAHALIHRAREIFSEASGQPASSESSGPCGRFTIALFRELRDHSDAILGAVGTVIKHARRHDQRVGAHIHVDGEDDRIRVVDDLLRDRLVAAGALRLHRQVDARLLARSGERVGGHERVRDAGGAGGDRDDPGRTPVDRVRALRRGVRGGRIGCRRSRAGCRRGGCGGGRGRRRIRVLLADRDPDDVHDLVRVGRAAQRRGEVLLHEVPGELGEHREVRLRRIRGSHLTFTADRLPLPEAVSLLHPRDQRAVFAIPWEGVTILGTTDVDHGWLDEEPAISDEERGYLLEAAQKAFPVLELTEKDIISTWSGVRPVINTGKSDPSKESREHAIWKEDGLLTITGGKLTTFAVMARDVLGAAEEDLGELQARTRVLEPSSDGLAWPEHISDDERLRLLGRFGAEIVDILADRQGCRHIDGSIALWSALRPAARAEGVVTLSDLLLRRVRLGLLLPNGGLDLIEHIRAVAQPELGWDDAKWAAEVASYETTWKKAYSP